MKKFLVLLLALVMMLSVFAFVACDTNTDDDTNTDGDTDTNPDKDEDEDDDDKEVITVGTAYGLVHTSYVGFASVTYTDEELTEAELDEMCTPLWYTATEEGEYTTTNGSKIYYTTFYVGEVATFTYDLTAGTYVLEDDTTTLLEWLGDATNCETYYTTVVEGELTVEAGETDTVLSAELLQKSLNGYWGTDTGKDEDFWLMYRDATLEYVLENGFDATSFDKNDDGYMTDNNGVVTGATWNYMQDYYDLLKTAAGLYEEPAVDGAVTEDGVYTGSADGSYGNSFDVTVTVTEGVVASVVIEDTSVTGTGGYDATFDAESDALLASFVGMTAQEVLDASTTSGFITGATDSCSALLAAVANALTVVSE